MEVKKTPILKDVYTNSLYQSTFLPIFERAEIRIKELILAAFLFGRSKYILRLSIVGIITEVAKQIPLTLRDRDQYIRALQIKSDFFVRKFYDAPRSSFEVVKKEILSSVPPGTKAPMLKTPKDVIDFVKSDKMWAEAKAIPNVKNYPREVKLRVNQLAFEPVTTQETGKRPISLWQKAELDVRYENQMQNLQNMRVEGVEYAWISSHPNCSKRCATWQGSLVALEKHAVAPQTVVDVKKFNYNKKSFLVGNVDGHNVYSLPDIMEVVDNKYGYHNNVICGFNCRHRLIPYTPGSSAPKEFSKQEIEQQRKIEEQIRNMEREIRLQRKRVKLYNELGEVKIARQIKSHVDRLVEYYKKFCEKNGYAWYKYRIEV